MRYLVRSGQLRHDSLLPRSLHSFPPKFVMPREWRPELKGLAVGLGLPSLTASAIDLRFLDVIQQCCKAPRGPMSDVLLNRESPLAELGIEIPSGTDEGPQPAVVRNAPALAPEEKIKLFRGLRR